MLDIEEIDNTIEELLEGPTTFDNVNKLASLYIVKDHIQNRMETTPDTSENVVDELDDILPAYRKYKEIKKQFQLKEVTKELVISSMKNVCREITEFIYALYGNTECEECRNLILIMIKSLDF